MCSRVAQALAGRLDQMTHCDPFNPTHFVILIFKKRSAAIDWENQLDGLLVEKEVHPHKQQHEEIVYGLLIIWLILGLTWFRAYLSLVFEIINLGVHALFSILYMHLFFVRITALQDKQ